MSRRTDEHELRDPALSALLRDTFANDPALEEAPGRTERIMRLVLASGVKPERRRFSWAPFGWALSAAGMAAVVVFLTMVLARTTMPGSNNQMANYNPPPKAVQQQEKIASGGTEKKVEAAPEVQPIEQPTLPIPKERTREPWNAPRPAQKLPAPSTVTVADNESTPEQIAATLYDAGTVAHSAGDYETAYTAFHASYEMVPTPSAVLASSDALTQLAAEALEG